MSTVTPNPQPQPVVGVSPHVVYAFMAAVVLLIAVMGGLILNKIDRPAPAPVVSPIPADAAAHLQGEVAALRSVAKQVRSGGPSDPASVSKAIAAARKATNDRLAADIQQGDVAANLDAVAAAMAALIKGAK